MHSCFAFVGDIFYAECYTPLVPGLCLGTHCTFGSAIAAFALRLAFLREMFVTPPKVDSQPESPGFGMRHSKAPELWRACRFIQISNNNVSRLAIATVYGQRNRGYRQNG